MLDQDAAIWAGSVCIWAAWAVELLQLAMDLQTSMLLEGCQGLGWLSVAILRSLSWEIRRGSCMSKIFSAQ